MMFHLLDNFSIFECLFYGMMTGLAIALIIGVLYGIREYRWSAAYNRGFVMASRNPLDSASIHWHATNSYRSVRLQKSFILGARHAKGY